MKKIDELACATEKIFQHVSRKSDVKALEVFAASNEQLINRLVCTSHIKCNGVEEPKSQENFGLGLQIIFTDGSRGFGSVSGDLTLCGADLALEKARDAKVLDPEFYGLPEATDYKRTLYNYHDAGIMDIDDRTFVTLGWKVIKGGIEKFRKADLNDQDGLILSGDVTLLKERIAVKSSNLGPEIDESTLIMSFVTAMVEKRNAKGSGYQIVKRLDDFSDISGREAAVNAIKTMDGVRMPSGKYTVIFGPQPVSDIFTYLFLPAITTPSFYTGVSPFLKKFGSKIVSETLTIVDDGCNPEFPGSKGITCDGLPTSRIELVRNGALTGLLSNHYELERLLHEKNSENNLGVSIADARKMLKPANGFRFAAGGGRSYSTLPGIAATNVLMYGKDEKPLQKLLREVKNGLYIGRIWYTYPMNISGDFTCSVIADSYTIENGEIARPLRINSLRINDNFVRILSNVAGVSDQRRGTLGWASDECTFLPEIAVPDVMVEEIKEP